MNIRVHLLSSLSLVFLCMTAHAQTPETAPSPSAVGGPYECQGGIGGEWAEPYSCEIAIEGDHFVLRSTDAAGHHTLSGAVEFTSNGLHMLPGASWCPSSATCTAIGAAFELAQDDDGHYAGAVTWGADDITLSVTALFF